MSSSYDPTVLLTNLAYITGILSDISVLVGIFFIIGSVLVFKRYGEMRGIMSHQMTIDASPLSIATTGIDDWDSLMQAVVLLTRIIGVVALTRGLCMLGKAGSQNRQPGAIGRGCIFVVAGVLCIHIVGTIYLLEYTLGIV
jgi:hypothetical protein